MFLERDSQIPVKFVGSLLGAATLTMTTDEQQSGERYLYIIECFDSVGGRHQLQIINERSQQGQLEISIQMTHPYDFLPIHKRFKWWFLEFRARQRKANQVH
jgi:hypothetical protein